MRWLKDDFCKLSTVQRMCFFLCVPLCVLLSNWPSSSSDVLVCVHHNVRYMFERGRTSLTPTCFTSWRASRWTNAEASRYVTWPCGWWTRLGRRRHVRLCSRQHVKYYWIRTTTSHLNPKKRELGNWKWKKWNPPGETPGISSTAIKAGPFHGEPYSEHE